MSTTMVLPPTVAAAGSGLSPSGAAGEGTWAWWARSRRKVLAARAAGEAVWRAQPQAELAVPLGDRRFPPLLLGAVAGEGSFHRAVRLLHPVGEGWAPSRWVAVGETRDPGWTEDTLAPEVIRREKDASDHLQRLTGLAPTLLPRYGGLCAILPQRGRRRFAHLWQAKDATFGDLVSRGGLVKGARVAGHALTAFDVAGAMLRLGELYAGLGALGMAYTDPKPENIAFDIAWRGGGPRAAQVSGRGLLEAAFGPPLDGCASARTAIRDIVFIDAESMHGPGYGSDRTIAADATLTPIWSSAAILRALQASGQALKSAQTSEASDVFHAAALCYGLLAGDAPQQHLAEARFQRQVLRCGPISGSQAAKARLDALIQVRLAGDYRHETDLLRRLVALGLIPGAMAETIIGGLHGHLQRLDEWEECSLAAATRCS